MRILSGIQPSGIPHLGNYFGYIQPNVSLQKTADVTLMIADLHALTTVQDPKAMRENGAQVALDLLACGFDAEKGTLFFQSHVAEHAELMWILATVSPMGLLERAVSFKEKVEKGITPSVGLFAYPVLQTADILLYNADTVPVGKDQKQHLEIARDITIKFNNAYGETFVLPEAMIREDSAVVPGTDGQKMSKSYGNTIPLFGTEKTIQKAIMGIVTDSKGVEEPKDPDTCTVYQIHKLFLSKDEAETLAEKYRAGGLGYGDAKKLLFSAYMDTFGTMRKKREELEKKPDLVREIIESGARKAKNVAQATMERVRKAVGLR